jgi:intraflagellar transport protein 57
VEEEIEANQDEDETYMDVIQTKRAESVSNQTPVKPKVDATEWKLEVERVTSSLKVQLPNNNKDWRIHLQQMGMHQMNIQGLMGSTQGQLDRIHDEISNTLEQITSREKYINSQFEGLVT